MNLPNRDRILIVEQDPAVADFISRQVLQAAGYQCQIMHDPGEALQKITQLSPDVILLDLKISGFSAKDFIVALRSQYPELLPVIVMAQAGTEIDVIQAFRLGAADYLAQPLREAEILSAVDRALAQGRANREKDQLSQKLQQVNLELQKRVGELSTISSIGKAVLSITDQTLLFDKILEETMRLIRSDIGWFMLREENSEVFLLAAQRKLPAVLALKVNQPWDDGISSFVIASGETLNIHGDALSRFPVSQLGKAFLLLPVKAKKHVIGLLVVVRKTDLPFSSSEQKLLESIVDYVSVALINSRLFQAWFESTRSVTVVSEQNKQQAKALMKQELKPHLMACLHLVEEFKQHEREVPPSLRKVLVHLTDEMLAMQEILDKVQTPGEANYSVNKGK